MNKTASLVCTMALALSACATPQYSVRPYALTNNPAMPEQQAKAVCLPKAELAAERARAEAEQNVASQNNRVTGYSCQNNYYGDGYGTSNCRSQTQGGGGFVGGYLAGERERNAYLNTGKMVLQSCMAQYGWGLKSVCVRNCN